MTKAFAIQWFKFACVLTVAVGFIAAAASYPQPKTLWLLLFDLLKWPLDGDPAGFAPTGYALNAVLGGVMASRSTSWPTDHWPTTPATSAKSSSSA